jgi:hypothetical protein
MNALTACLALSLLGSTCLPCAHGAAPLILREDADGDLEHYHHEYYSHSYVDPNYQEAAKSAKGESGALSKKGRAHARPRSGFTFAFGGHRRDGGGGASGGR